MNTHFRWQVSVTLEADPGGARPVLAGFARQSDAEHWADMIGENPEYEEVHVDEIPGQALTPEVQALVDAAFPALHWIEQTGIADHDPEEYLALRKALAPFSESLSPAPVE